MEHGIELTAIRARERYRNDMRFHAMAQSIVARVLQEHGRIDPERADRDANDIAVRVAATVLEMVFENDAELNAQREMAERYRKLAEEALLIAPMPTFVRVIPPTIAP